MSQVNFMKYAANYFRKGQLEKIFFLFADPHFKQSNHRRRVINANFLAIYAYILQVGGMLYTITDVLDLHNWEVEHLSKHPLFERIPDAELQEDPCYLAMHSATEEGQKVTRLHGSKYPAVYRRIAAKDEE
jgi:tRNA (guanine-N7-)-methyltransferase